jgi:ABC-type multidrug transport system fused ATPase/permease subunit
MILVAIMQFFVALLDLIGVAIIGVLGALSVNSVGSKPVGTRLGKILGILNIDQLPFQKQALVLGLISVVFLLTRTFLSIYFNKKILLFLSQRGAIISSNLISRLLGRPLAFIQSRSVQENIFILTRGVEVITIQILAMSLVLVSDIALLFILFIGLLVLDSITAVSMIVFFAVLGLVFYWQFYIKASKLGHANSYLTIISNNKIAEVIGSYRESLVHNRRHYYARQIREIRFKLANVSAELSFMPLITKYTLETAVVIGAMLISLVQFITNDATHAVATLAIFLAAGSRIAPAVIRIQQGLLGIRVGTAAAKPTIELIEKLASDSPLIEADDNLQTDHKNFSAEIYIDNIKVEYQENNITALKNLSLNVEKGTFVAIVGPTGSGKTTLVDTILGIIQPTKGSVEISGETPSAAIRMWPGAMSYVPQQIHISNGSVLENIALGYPINSNVSLLALESLKLAELNLDLDYEVGENGSNLSGGQKQRLGIARALFTKPKLLVLDEATSALDAEIESSISKTIFSMRGNVTVITIAHRLSTIRGADKVVYLENGEIKATGSFEEVRSKITNFDSQARLMGL